VREIKTAARKIHHLSNVQYLPERQIHHKTVSIYALSETNGVDVPRSILILAHVLPRRRRNRVGYSPVSRCLSVAW